MARLGLAVAVAAGLCFGASGLAAARDVLVFAAASQKDALDAVIEAYEAGGGGDVDAAYESSSTLARQIEQGAPADIFVSANPKWMDYVEERGLIDKATRKDLLGNSLVLIVPKDSTVGTVTIAPGFDLAGMLGDSRMAMGDPDHVPAGTYGRQALESLGVWSDIEPKVARADNVRAALALVSRGETPFGIVYGSDAVADKTVRVAGTFPDDSHPAIIYPVAVTTDASNAEAAAAFLAFMATSEAAAIFERYGFRLLD
ncbi:MAG: molybdate ABC transporter substrate-binding protein [Rhodospirillaceae bacterium]|nr:molybdate ABC transporter substrate-binding protein [Rhodospirillaceae bacterium]